MALEYKVENSILILYLRDSIRVYNIDEFYKQISRVIKEQGAHRVILNFKGVPYMDSSGLGMLLNLQFNNKQTIRFRFCGFRDEVNKVLKYTSLNTCFPIDAQEEDSVMMLKNA